MKKLMNYFDLIQKYGLKEVKEQKEFLTNPDFTNPTKPLVLAGGTGFGKTFTTILKLILFYLNPDNKGKKTVVLPSSTKVLRSNFFKAFMKLTGLPFCIKMADSKREFNRLVKQNECDVIVVLPQTLAGIAEMPKIEWLVVDEAHKWYFADTIKDIIEKSNPTYQLLLTGTPFKFNAKKDDYLMYYVPIEDMMAAGNIHNPLIEVVTSSVDLKNEDYSNDNNQVRTNIKWSYMDDKSQLTAVAKEMSKMLKTRYRYNTIGRLLSIFGIEKTMIYCYSKHQANHFYKVFQSSELAGKVLISHSENDIDSVEFDKFQENEDYRVLLVVDRGREGFDMPELFNIVDFTLSTNPEVILQILGRLFRLSAEQPNKQKVYYKVASQNTAGFIQCLMTGILHLVNREYYETFTGDLSMLKVPMMPIKPRVKNEPRDPRNKGSFSTRVFKAFNQVNIPLTANFWNEIKTKHSDVFKGYANTNLKQVIAEIAGNKGKDFLTKEYFDEIVKTFNVKTYKQLKGINPALALKAARPENQWDKDLEKTTPQQGGYSLQQVVDFMKEHNITEFKQFSKFSKGQPIRKAYIKYVNEGVLEDTAKKSTPGHKKGYKYSDEDKKKMSQSVKQAWDNRKKRQGNFTLSK
jgi:superfamily II DNA or RNA helicase